MSPLAAAVAGFDFGKPGAVKRGRSPARPYVPLRLLTPGPGRVAKTIQIRGLAFATRAEALASAAGYIERLREHLREQLLSVGCRALRRSMGLPEELAELIEVEALAAA